MVYTYRYFLFKMQLFSKF